MPTTYNVHLKLEKLIKEYFRIKRIRVVKRTYYLTGFNITQYL
jgi:hypothetical protein